METPILSSKATGAVAKPLLTSLDAFPGNLELRIAPELFLKKLVIGGMHKVFEIGKQFRNEGIDSSHSPEFTSCEFYEAFATTESTMLFTEKLLKDLCVHIKGEAKISINKDCEIDFTVSFARIDICDYFLREFQVDLLEPSESILSTKLHELMQQKNIECNSPQLEKKIDKIISELIEPKCIQPTFLTGFPLIMTPLAKEITPGKADNFELIINGKELVNSYSEQTDAVKQRQQFYRQNSHLDSACEDYCEALEYGLPPTTGWGIGLDRLVMLFVGSKKIKDVILFPLVRPKVD